MFHLRFLYTDRLVDCSPIKKAIDGVFSTVLPKGAHPWVYLALSIDPPNVDVNVHPTKSEVRFLHEMEIVQEIQDAFTMELEKHSASRTFTIGEASTQMAVKPPPSSLSFKNVFGDKPPESRPPSGSNPSQIAPNKTVRVDPTMRTMDSFFATSSLLSTSVPVQTKTQEPPQQQKAPEQTPEPEPSKPPEQSFITEIVVPEIEPRVIPHKEPPKPLPVPIVASPKKKVKLTEPITIDEQPEPKQPEQPEQPEQEVMRTTIVGLPRRHPRNYRVCALTSIMTQIQTIQEQSHVGIENILSESTFVGFVDDSFVLIQHQTKMYMCNMSLLVPEFFRQQVFFRFGNFDRVVLEPKLGLEFLLDAAISAIRIKQEQYVKETGEKFQNYGVQKMLILL